MSVDQNYNIIILLNVLIKMAKRIVPFSHACFIVLDTVLPFASDAPVALDKDVMTSTVVLQVEVWCYSMSQLRSM